MNYIDLILLASRYAYDTGMSKSAALFKVAGGRGGSQHGQTAKKKRNNAKNLAEDSRIRRQTREVSGSQKGLITDAQAGKITHNPYKKGRIIDRENGRKQQENMRTAGNMSVSGDGGTGKYTYGDAAGNIRVGLKGEMPKKLNKHINIAAPDLEGGKRTQFRTGRLQVMPEEMIGFELRDYMTKAQQKQMRKNLSDTQVKLWDRDWEARKNGIHAEHFEKAYMDAVNKAKLEREALEAKLKDVTRKYDNTWDRLQEKIKKSSDDEIAMDAYRKQIASRDDRINGQSETIARQMADNGKLNKKLRKSRILAGLGIAGAGTGAYLTGRYVGKDKDEGAA